MKLLLMAGLMFSGGTAAMQNETINEEVTQAYNQVKVMVQNRFQGNLLDQVKEGGYPYPNETFLANLTEEQQLIYVSTIDQINAEYDWSTMTDEEILSVLQDIKVELQELREELGIEAVQTQTRNGNHWNEDFEKFLF